MKWNVIHKKLIKGEGDGRDEEKEEQDSPAETEEVRRADIGHRVIAGVDHSEVMHHEIQEGNPVIQEEQEECLIV